MKAIHPQPATQAFPKTATLLRRAHVAVLAVLWVGCGASPSHGGPEVAPTLALKVGTTGDYAPFSAREGNILQGFDIALAEAFAAALGRPLELVPTRWPTLTSDISAGRFAMALSGITHTAARDAHMHFSTPYATGRKVALVRCSEQSRFPSLTSLDQESVTIWVNRGGTNEAFAETHLPQATRRYTDNNQAIFPQLAAGQGDAMVTDDVEAFVQQRCNPSLCIALAEARLAPFHIAAAFPPEEDSLRARFDAFLTRERESGRLAEGLQHAIRSAPCARPDEP